MVELYCCKGTLDLQHDHKDGEGEKHVAPHSKYQRDDAVAD